MPPRGPTPMPKYRRTLEGKAFVKGYLDVAWHYNGLDESAGVTADIGGPALHGVPSIHGVQIIEEDDHNG